MPQATNHLGFMSNHPLFIVEDIHLEHYLENKNQKFGSRMCSKYTLRTPTKTIHLEHVLKGT